ncbi:MAG: hypothetical protein VX438_08240, partial [Planctomycetota bacterium]|nr:hypothetical protein [Planctomycetota bacterium]
MWNVRHAKPFSCIKQFSESLKGANQVNDELPTQNRRGLFIRWTVYLLIIGSASAAASYRIRHVNVFDVATQNLKSSEGSPLLCANDRSRWCTLRALGDHNRYEIDDIIADPQTGEFSFDRRKYNPFWATIDLVKHRDQHGEMHFYSSKPTLLPTLLAYLYKVVKMATGKDLENHPFAVVQLMLILVNVIPMALFLVLLAATLEILSEDSFTKIILVIAASYGTFLTPFAITLNNHLPAAISVGITLFTLVYLLNGSTSLGIHYFNAGIFSAFAAANELPALSFLCFVGLILSLSNLKKTLCFFVPGATLVIAAFFYTNHAAHHDWIPPYAHRNDGPLITTLTNDLFNDAQQHIVSPALVQAINVHR